MFGRDKTAALNHSATLPYPLSILSAISISSSIPPMRSYFFASSNSREGVFIQGAPGYKILAIFMDDGGRDYAM